MKMEMGNCLGEIALEKTYVAERGSPALSKCYTLGTL